MKSRLLMTLTGNDDGLKDIPIILLTAHTDDSKRLSAATVAEVCYQVGINDPHYFGKVFKQQFGISPKKYQQGVHQEKKDVPV